MQVLGGFELASAFGWLARESLRLLTSSIKLGPKCHRPSWQLALAVLDVERIDDLARALAEAIDG
jgi:hypothetical protein